MGIDARSQSYRTPGPRARAFERAERRDNTILKATWAFALVALAVMLFMAARPVSAAETPTSLPGGKIVTVEEARSLAGKAQFYDMRKAINYGKGHIRGAIALPYDERSEKAASFDAAHDSFDRSKLPADKNAPILFYSDGPTGWKSYKAAVLAAKAGHTNVMWMRGGIKEWKAKGFALE